LLRSTHKTIAEKIAPELKLSEKNTQLLISGSVGPDTHCDFPHQTGKEQKILYKIDTARTLFLQNDDECYGNLGNALHYIQDKWTRNTASQETISIIDDNLLLQSITKAKMSKKATEDYLQTAKALLTIKNSGIESWFNHSWGIWHKDYASCIYMFADVLELMLPTLQPDVTVTFNKEKLRAYLKSDAFKNSTQKAFHASIKVNFLYPKLSGYPAAIHTLASINPPNQCCNALTDLNIAYRLSLEIARYTFSLPEQLKYRDNWTQKSKLENRQSMNLAYVVPKYHVLIPSPTAEIREERIAHFEESCQDFLANWPSTEKTLKNMQHCSDTSKMLLTELVELLKQNEN
jgi:hypothetical protein